MVDLVKIRKKAKEKSAEGRAKAEQQIAERQIAEQQDAEALRIEPPEVAPMALADSDPGASLGEVEPVATPVIADADRSTKLDRFKAEAGRRRVVEGTRTAEVDSPDQLELLTFIIAGEQYAVDIERIVEIVTPRPVTRIPNADSSVVGIISLRGTIVTLVDVRRKLHHRNAPALDADARIIVVEFKNETVGFLVDRVLRVTKTGREEIESHPVVHATELDDSIRGVFRVSGALTILIDLDKLLDRSALAVG